MSTSTTFKGISHIGDPLLNEQLKANLLEYCKWASLCIGGFFNVHIPTSGAYGGDFHRLRPVANPYYDDAQIWEAARSDWVWQTGIYYPYQPIQISGIYINGDFLPNNAASTGFIINYPRGQVIFDDPLPTSTIVELEYSYNWIHWTTSDVPWFREIMFNSFRVDSPEFLQYGSGIWSQFSSNRIQLPAVVIQLVPSRSFEGFQLGGGHDIKQDVLFHILADQPYDRDKLVDIITYQHRKTLLAFDLNEMYNKDKFPLDYDGSLRPSAMMYPQFILPTADGGLYWGRKIFFENMRSTDIRDIYPLWEATIRCTLRITMEDL